MCFDSIGAIYRTSSGEYDVGPIAGFGGPFKTATEYYEAWAKSAKSNIGIKPEKNQPFPARLQTIARRISNYNLGPFSVVHVDFGNYNILVDDEYNIRSIIDWDCAAVLPIEFAAVYPADLHTLPEIYWIGSPMDNDQRREEERDEKVIRERYIEFIEAEEEKRGFKKRLSHELEGMNAFIALSIKLYEDGSQNPLCRIIDLFEDTHGAD